MDEYISRDAVLRKFIEGDGHDDDRFTEGYNFAVQEYRDKVKKIPTADVQPVSRWIDAQKNPPPVLDKRCMSSESVLILMKKGRCAVAYYCYDAEDGNFWTTDDDRTIYELDKVTYWQPLPAPPKEE